MMTFDSKKNTLSVLKLGGSVIQGTDDFKPLCELVESHLQTNSHLVIVVSAFKGMTDQLLAQAHAISKKPSARELDMLVSIGERMAASLLCIALEDYGITAKSYTGSQAGILTSNQHSQACILDIQPYRIYQALTHHRVIVVAGFQGVSRDTKEITTLGRGGSDTSAVALAIALKARRTIFFKDVGGLFDKDPHLHEDAMQIPFCDYDFAHHLMQNPKFILHPRAVKLAAINQIPLHIASPYPPFKTGTLISKDQFFTDKVDFETTSIYEEVHDS